jgi:hypothetical protein
MTACILVKSRVKLVSHKDYPWQLALVDGAAGITLVEAIL